MKAAVLLGPERIEIRETAEPEKRDDEIIVRLENCGICTLEQRLFRGDIRIHYPIIPGHEASGEIVEVGPAVIGGIQRGMRVALDLVTRCGECYYCRTGQSNMCSNRFTDGQRVLGGFAEYISVRASQVFPVSDEVSFREAAFAEPLACCIHSLKKISLTIGEDLLILGAGPMGLIHLQAANCMGARVIVSDPDRTRLEVASELGAYRCIDPGSEDLTESVYSETEGRGPDACVITSMADTALTTAFNVLAKTGRMNIYTSYLEKLDLPVDANILHRNEYLITGSEGRTEIDFQQAVRLIEFRKIQLQPLISKVVGFSGLEEGIHAALTPETFRVLLEQRLGE